MNMRSWWVLGAVWLIGAVLCPSPAYSAELDVPRVMLKNIGYDIRLDGDSLDHGTHVEAIRLVVDDQVIPLVKTDDQLIFPNVRA
ncbi:MAG: hypothetical protein VXA98_04870, partial [Gammaproteobacteria bacterium]